MTEELNGSNKLALFGSLAMGVSVAGALGSLALTLQAAIQNHSVILKLLFSAWVLSPFFALIIICTRSNRRPSQLRIALYILMIGISIVSLLFYGGILSFTGVRHAFIFLAAPFTTWIIISLMYVLLARI